MTTTLLPVTQADRDAAASVAEHWHNHGREHPRVHYENVANGVDDEWILVQAFARHRVSHSLPGDVVMRALVEEFCLAKEYAAGCDEGVDADAAASEIWGWAGSPMAVVYTKARAALPSPQGAE